MNTPASSSSGAKRTWRVGHQGRDTMYYEEMRDGAWQRIEIPGEMLTGRAHHVIYFHTPERWQSYPEWARDRREEIIARVTSEFREPDYEYQGASTTAASPAGASRKAPVIHPQPRKSRPRVNKKASPESMSALLLAIALLLSISGLMAWLVARGVSNGETSWPAKRASQRRAVLRLQEPVMYWTAIGSYAAVGLGTLCLGVWGIVEGRRIRSGRR